MHVTSGAHSEEKKTKEKKNRKKQEQPKQRQQRNFLIWSIISASANAESLFYSSSYAWVCVYTRVETNGIVHCSSAQHEDWNRQRPHRRQQHRCLQRTRLDSIRVYCYFSFFILSFLLCCDRVDFFTIVCRECALCDGTRCSLGAGASLSNVDSPAFDIDATIFMIAGLLLLYTCQFHRIVS